MGIADVRTHDWFGVADLDGKIDAARLQQPAYSATDVQTARQLIGEVANKRTMFLNAQAGQGDNFAATDSYLQRVQSALSGVEILFRVGRSLGAGDVYPVAGKALDTYLSLVKKTVRRYGLQYANYGLQRRISYWEIGNEPDEGDFFSGSAEDFYHFFAKVYLAIKSVDPSALVGGSGVANLLANDGRYVQGFLNYCSDNNIGIDFFSWHHYANGSLDPYDYARLGRTAQSYLKTCGFGQVQSFLSEWNLTPTVSLATVSALQTPVAASFIASSLIYLQDAQVDKAYFYRSDAMHLGMFNREHAYTCSAKAFVAFNRLRATPYRLAIASSSESTDSYGQDTLGYAVLAGADAPPSNAGAVRKIQILLSNYQIDPDYLDAYTAKPYAQYAVDTSQSAEHIDRNLYYGGKDPATLDNQNDDTFQSSGAFPAGGLQGQKLADSGNQGLMLKISLPTTAGYSQYRARFAWVSEASNLDRAELDTLAGADPITGPIATDGMLSIQRPELTPGRILLVTIDLS